jgi:MobA-like NTP transferase domain
LQIVVPMAGEGKRFQEAGYRTPKPLIPVTGVPMAVRAVQDLPKADRYVFVVRTEHVREHGLDQVLRRHFPGCRIVAVSALTQGQACTVALAGPELEPDWPVIVGACDCTHLYDRDKLAAILQDVAIACSVWTYRPDSQVLLKPTQLSWACVNGGRLLRVSCKQPISDQPSNDLALSGFFTFRTAHEMLSGIEQLVASGQRVNNEFYLDVVPNLLIATGRLAVAFEVTKYIGWGTPADLENSILPSPGTPGEGSGVRAEASIRGQCS